MAVALIVVYMVAMVAIGIWGMRRSSNLNDFFLGGRSIGPWVSALSYGTTYFSAVLFIGFAGTIGWKFGLNALWIAAGNTLIGAFLAWYVLGRRTRRMTQNLEAMTMPEFFAARYGARWMKPAAAVVVFVFLLPYSASVYKGLGYLFQSNFDIKFEHALLMMTVITGLYLVLGGYFAVTFTDFVQGLIMVVGSIAMVAILTIKAGGPSAAISTVATAWPAHVATQPPMYMLAALVFMTSFGTWGLPQMVQKFYAIRDERVINLAAWVTMGFSAIIVTSAYYTGALTHVFYNELPKVAHGEVFDQLIPDMLKQNLPQLLMAVILLLVLSASMSTLSSLVLVSSSAIAIDLCKDRMSGDDTRTNRQTVLLMRVLSTVFVAISFVIALKKVDLIVTLMSVSWGAVAGAFLAPYVYGLYWRGATAAGAAAAAASGLAVAIGLHFWLGAAKAPVTASIAMIVPMLVLPAVSLVTRKPDEALVRRAFGE